MLFRSPIVETILRESAYEGIDRSLLSTALPGDVLWRVVSFLLWHEMFIGRRTAVFDAIEGDSATRGHPVRRGAARSPCGIPS